MAETHQAEIAGQLAEWRGRGGGKAAEEEPRGPAKVIQLPLWPEPKRGAPNAVLRGALFAAVHKDRQLYGPPGAARGPGWYHYPVSPGSSSTNPTWTCGNRPYTWPGRRPSAQSVISRPTAFSRPSGQIHR